MPEAKKRNASSSEEGASAKRAKVSTSKKTNSKTGKRSSPDAKPAPEDKTARSGRSKGALFEKLSKPANKGANAAATADDKPSYYSYAYLMKNEPENYSVDDLEKDDDQTCHWEGVRNYRARNIMQAMKKGQQAFFYHSNCKVPAVVGIVEIVREAYPDHFAWDKASPYFDEKSTPENPRWFMVDVKLVRKLQTPVSLEEIKKHKDGELKDMQLLTTSRLSVQNVTKEQWELILKMSEDS